VLLAHLSDPHLTIGPLLAGPAAGLHAALGRLLGLPTRPDAVVITGDLTDHGRPEEYDQLAQLLDGVPLPVHLATGNHDDRDALLGAFAGTSHLGGQDRAHYAVDLPGARLLVLDSLVPGSGAGRLDVEQLAWLDDQLGQRPGTPALLALHHPPVAVGIPFLDGMRLLDADALAGVVTAHPQVVRVLCGHVHRATTAPFATTLVTTAPSTHRQSALDMTSPGTMGYLDEPTSFLLHQLTDATGHACVTHSVPVSGAAAVQFAIIPR
jgi:3',5'-cyclic AMP phosphodiesterase CpdA